MSTFINGRSPVEVSSGFRLQGFQFSNEAVNLAAAFVRIRCFGGDQINPIRRQHRRVALVRINQADIGDLGACKDVVFRGREEKVKMHAGLSLTN